MGAIGGLLGTAGGASGTGFSGPSRADLANPATMEGINAGQAGVNNALGSQNNLLAALQGQNSPAFQSLTNQQGQNLYAQMGANNGLGVQGAAMGQQGQLAGQLGAANGIGAQMSGIQGLQNVLAQQQGTAGQLQGIANGTGPNPAQAALNQATGQNVANQAALMAGQRGAGSNVGLLARQAGQQGAGIQQQAVGQGATMQAQQELGAINALGQQEQAMGATNQGIAGIGSGLTGAQQAAINARFGQGTQAVGQMQGQLAQNAGMAQNMVANQMGTAAQNVQGNLGNTGQQLGAMGQFNSTQAGQQANVNTANAGLAAQNMKGQQGLIGGVLNAAGPMIGAPAAAAAVAGGGLVKDGTVQLADGGMPAAAPAAPAVPNPNGPSSSVGQFLKNWGAGFPTEDAGADALNKGMTSFGTGLGQFVRSQFQTDPGSTYTGQPTVSPAGMSTTGSPTGDFLGGNTSTASYLSGQAKGGAVKASSPKEKAVAPGNSYANDKIPALLSEGEIIIPRNVLQSKDPARSAADFVRKTLAKRGNK